MMRALAPNSGSGTVLLSFDVFGWRIALTDCPDVADGLEMILHGWAVRRLSAGNRRRVHAHVIKTEKGYHWHSEAMPRPALWETNPPLSAMSVISDLHDVFFDWFLKENPRYLCLHGAAVRIGDGLVCFPSVGKSGKSTLCVEFMASGETVHFCDDVLPFEPQSNRGLAMGIAPLLRKPLPARASPELRDFVARRKGPRNQRWLYVRLEGTEIAPYGETAPVKALALLDRRSRGRARLLPVSKSEMLKEVILQNFADQLPPVEILDRLLGIVQSAGCYRLQFARSAEAALLLRRTFGRANAS
jgi:hypothetical protein